MVQNKTLAQAIKDARLAKHPFDEEGIRNMVSEFFTRDINNIQLLLIPKLVKEETSCRLTKQGEIYFPYIWIESFKTWAKDNGFKWIEANNGNIYLSL